MTIKISSAANKISSVSECQTYTENSTQLKIKYIHVLQEQHKLYMRQDSVKHTHHIHSNNVSRKILYKT
jgi:hypothetical protein